MAAVITEAAAIDHIADGVLFFLPSIAKPVTTVHMSKKVINETPSSLFDEMRLQSCPTPTSGFTSAITVKILGQIFSKNCVSVTLHLFPCCMITPLLYSQHSTNLNTYADALPTTKSATIGFI